MTDRERYVNARKEARRYQRKYLYLKQAIENIKHDLEEYITIEGRSQGAEYAIHIIDIYAPNKTEENNSQS